MEYIEQLQDYLPNYVPNSWIRLSHLSSLSSYSGMVLSTINSLTTRLHALSLQLTSESSASPSLTTILLLLVILFLSLKILDMLYRTLMFWIKMLFRVAVMVAVVGGGAWVYVRGVDGITNDVRELVDYWGSEVKRYEAMGRAGEGYKKGW